MRRQTPPPVDPSATLDGERHTANDTPRASTETPQSYIAILDLVPIRREIRRTNWPSLRERVLSVVQHMARGMIAATNSLAIHDDETCVITFDKTTYESAVLAAAAISKKVVCNLFGEDGLKRVSLEPRVLAFKDLVSHGFSVDTPGKLHRVMPVAHNPGLRGDLAATPAGARTQLPTSSSVQEERRERRRKIISLFAEDRTRSVFNTYLPLWNKDSMMVAKFQLVPCRRDNSSTVLCGYSVLGVAHSDRALIAFDIESIENGLLALKEALDADRDVALILPLHFDTAGSSQGLAELMEIFPNLPSFLRNRLSFTLSGVPNGVPEGRLHQVVNALKPLVKDVVINVEPRIGTSPSQRSMLGRIRSIGLKCIAITFSSSPSSGGLNSACAISSRAVSLGLEVCALGLVSGLHAHRLSVAGCTNIGGTLFGGPFHDLPAPYPVYPKVFEQSD